VRAGLGDEALLVPPNDPEALVAAITRVASDGDLRAVFRELGLARVAAFISNSEASEPGSAAEHRLSG
jgi:glycosyltransferase involved in cell wall biosynthesis